MSLTHFAILGLNHVDNVLAGRNCPWALSANQRAVLQAVRSRVGKGNAISLTFLALQSVLSAREVKAAVSDLRKDFKVAIGASRGKPGGYYLIATAEEARDSAHYLIQQATSMLAVARVLVGRHEMLQLYGQLAIKLDLKEEVAREVQRTRERMKRLGRAA